MKNIILIFILFLSFSCKKNNINHVKSPDGKIQFCYNIEKGKFCYNVIAEGNDIIKKSFINFEFKNQPKLFKDLKITNVSLSKKNETWETICGESQTIKNHYNQLEVTLNEINSKKSFKIVARVYNDGIAFRYFFPINYMNDSLLIISENTEFNFPTNDSAWWIPSDDFAYESIYRNTKLNEIIEVNTPFTVKQKNGYFVCIHEAALYDYSEMYLKNIDKNRFCFVSSLWKEPDGVACRVKLPFKSPWRCILINKSANDLIKNNLIENVNEPCKIKDVTWIKPLKFIGIWWDMHIGKKTWFYGINHGANTKKTKEYIDFASKHNIQGVLTEGWNEGWDTWVPGKKSLQNFCKPYPDFDLKEIVKYAKSKNVEFIAHHETGGNIIEYEKQIDSAFSLLNKLGVHYLKTGYAGQIIPKGYHHHGQFMVRHFQKVVEKAAKYKICLDVHESIKPTGICRTYPNLLSQEAVRGNEWNATYKATPPYHATILPFTRFIAGAADYTPGIFHINHSPDVNKRLYCTLTYQLAMFVVFKSPMMMLSDRIENYVNNRALSFIENLPNSWEETHVIAAEPGDFVSIAKRKNKDWFIGSIVDEKNYLIKIPLSFLERGVEYIATIYSDSITTNWENNPESIEITKLYVNNRDTIYSAISKAGGNAIILSPIRKNIVKNKKISNIHNFNKTALIKMQEFDKLPTYGKLLYKHLALNKTYKQLCNYSSRYAATGNFALTDGIIGDFNFSSGNWQGYEGSDFDITVDLEKIISINNISIRFLNSPNDWIFLPLKVDFFISENGNLFSKIGEINYKSKNERKMDIVEIKDYNISLKHKKAKYIRIIAKSNIKCPPWHYGKDNKSWLFCDEVTIN